MGGGGGFVLQRGEQVPVREELWGEGGGEKGGDLMGWDGGGGKKK